MPVAAVPTCRSYIMATCGRRFHLQREALEYGSSHREEGQTEDGRTLVWDTRPASSSLPQALPSASYSSALSVMEEQVPPPRRCCEFFK